MAVPKRTSRFCILLLFWCSVLQVIFNFLFCEPVAATSFAFMNASHICGPCSFNVHKQKLANRCVKCIYVLWTLSQMKWSWFYKQLIIKMKLHTVSSSQMCSEHLIHPVWYVSVFSVPFCQLMRGPVRHPWSETCHVKCKKHLQPTNTSSFPVEYSITIFIFQGYLMNLLINCFVSIKFRQAYSSSLSVYYYIIRVGGTKQLKSKAPVSISHIL